MDSLHNDRFLKALTGQPVDRTPTWIMRQAGRYLPEYREVRKKAGNFINLMKNPQLCCEVTLQPLERYPLDAAIIFSDILTIPDALNLGLSFQAGEGPVIARPIRNEADVAALPDIQVEESLCYVSEAIKVTKAGLNNRVPLIGFSGSPWTLATYMVEGGSSKNFSIIKSMMYSRPELLALLLDKTAELVADYLVIQAEAGANALMLFDSWGGVLSPKAYQQFSLKPMAKIIHQVKERLGEQQRPIILFTKNGGQWLEQMVEVGPDALGLDWTTDIGDAFDRVGGQVALQGNLDPCVLKGSDEVIRQEASEILAKVGGRPGHIFNLGHGIHPDVEPEKLGVLIDHIQSWKN